MLPALAILAGSTLLGAYNNREAEKRRESVRRSMEAYQRSKAAETTAATEALINKQTPVARAQEMADVTNERQQSLKDTVGAVQGLSTATPVAGKISGDFKSTEEANAGRIAERTRRAIEQMATMGAPSEQQQRFGIRFGRAAGTVDAGNRASANVGDAYLTDMHNVRPNPMLNLVSQVGMGVGGGMIGGPAGAAAAGATSAQPNLTSPKYADWGSLDDGPGAYDTRRAKVARGFSLWGR